MTFFKTNIPFSIKIENQNEKEKNNEVTSILISNSDSTENDNIKIQELVDKEKPQKKEKIFKVIYSNDSSIFNYGIYDNYSKQMIYEALNQIKNKCLNKKRRSLKLFFQFPKKPHKKKKYIFTRKQNSDNIRKKIKARFLKSLKNGINRKLKKAGSKIIFAYLPQSFICNLSKDINKKVLNMSLQEIFAKNFCNGKEREADLKNYKHNLFVLNYLENNKEISEKSNYNNIKNMKYSEIFNEYLKSKEFGLEISTLKQKKENEKYIKDYIVKALNLLNFKD